MRLTRTNGTPIYLNVHEALSIAPSGSGTELVYPFPLARVRVRESFATVTGNLNNGKGRS